MAASHEVVSEMVDGLAASAEEGMGGREEKGNPEPHPYGYDELMLGRSEAEVRVMDCPQPCASWRRCNGVQPSLISEGG